MSFHCTEVQKSPLLSEAANVTSDVKWIAPTAEHISELPPALKNLEIKPHQVTTLTSEFLEALLEFEVRSDDVYVCSLPKSGSSWTTTIAWLLTHNLDYKTIDTVSLAKVMGDFDEIFNFEAASKKTDELLANDKTNSLTKGEAKKLAWNAVFSHLEAPRVFKSHNQSYFLPRSVWTEGGARVIYVVRNMKDTAISEYHFMRNFLHSDITVDDTVNGITNDIWFQSPQINHILNYWNLRHLPNVHFVFYEDLVDDSFNTIKKISEFLGCSYNDGQLKTLTEFVSFKNMKKNKAINREADVAKMEEVHGKKRPDAEFTFLRKGKVGGYRDELTENQIKKFDDWIEKELKGSDFKFK